MMVVTLQDAPAGTVVFDNSPDISEESRWVSASPPQEAPMVEDAITRHNWDRKLTAQPQHLNGSSGTVDIDVERYISTILPPLPPTSRQNDRDVFRVLQKWEGYVIEVTSDTFWARLVKLIGEGGNHEVEIYISQVDPEDHSLLVPGSVFYWSIGYEDLRSGRRKKSVLRFRRSPPWTGRNLLSGAEEEEFRNLFEFPSHE